MQKKIVYKSDNGLQFAFSNTAPYYLEKIDATSIAGVFTTDIIPDRLGQVTTSKTFGGRTIVCELAVVFGNDEMKTFKKQILSELTECFTPLSNGVLEIETDFGTYKINCYPQESLKFDNSEVSYVYRFTVDLICDYPYFKNVKTNKNTLTANESTIISSRSRIDNREIIIAVPNFNANFTLTNETTNKEIRLKKFGGGKVILDVLNFKLITGDGTDVSQFIDITCDIEDFCLKYGANKLTANLDATIEYSDILLGVM